MKLLDYFSLDPSNCIDMTKYKKIAISGLHGSGKTSLAKKINHLTFTPYLPEVAREIIEFTSNFDWRECKDINIIRDFEKAIFHTHLCLVKTNDVFVSDRSLVDPLVYVMVQNKKFNNALKSLVEEFTSVIENIGVLYDVILLTKAENSYADLSKFTELDFAVKELFESREIIELLLKLTKSLFFIEKGRILIFNEGVIVV